MDQEKIGKFIKERRQELGLTQKQISDALGITAKAVSKWECGQNAPDISLLVDLSKILNVTTDEILIGCKESEKKAPIDKVTTRKLRVKTIVEIVLLVLVLAITTATVFFGTYYIENKNKCNIYKIYTQSTELEAEGYIIVVGKKARLMLGKLSYNGIDNERIIDYKITLEIDGKNVFFRTIDDGEIDSLQNIINKHDMCWNDEVNTIVSKKDKQRKPTISLKIDYTNINKIEKHKSYIFKIENYYSS